MISNNQETLEDIVVAMRHEGHTGEASVLDWIRTKMTHYAGRIEAALRRKADCVHRAMVIIAGIELESADDPPRLWTALEDAYDALSDALGTDGETTADVEEAKKTGRYFVVKPSGNAAKMREALKQIHDRVNSLGEECGVDPIDVRDLARAALSAPPRNCDIGTSEEQAKRFYTFCEAYRAKSGIKGVCSSLCPCIRCSDMCHCLTKWSQMPYKEGGAK